MPTTRRRKRAASTAAAVSSAAREPAKVLPLSKVDAVRRRIAKGYYDRDEVRDRLALAVLAELRKD